MIPLPAEVPVNLGDRSYLIYVGRNNLERVADLASPIRGVIGVVTDTNVGPLYERRVTEILEGHGHRVVVYRMPAGEENKRLDAVEAICGAFLEGGLDRASMVVALGGGVVGDVAGFAAGVFMRGIPFIQVPTTIVAQVDSSVGGKTGVNHPLGKNTIGVFHQPSGVVIDMELLRTLPPRELRAGLAEVVKHGVIADADLFAYMEREAGRLLAGDPEALAFPVVRSMALSSQYQNSPENPAGLSPSETKTGILQGAFRKFTFSVCRDWFPAYTSRNSERYPALRISIRWVPLLSSRGALSYWPAFPTS